MGTLLCCCRKRPPNAPDIELCRSSRVDVDLSVRPVGGLVANRMGMLYQGGKDEAKSMIVSPRGPPLSEVPLKVLATGKWQVTGIHVHTALKVGLRQLDKMLEGKGLDVWTQGKYMMKKKLLEDFIAGKQQLNATSPSDMSAAQHDVRQLSLVQLLRIKVQNLDNDLKGEVHKVFMSMVDTNLLKEIGEKATTGVRVPDNQSMSALGMHALMMLAVSTRIPAPTHHVWWFSESCRRYFDVLSFSCTASTSFPSGGVLESADYGKKDVVSDTVMMDWQVKHISKEADLKSFAEYNRSHNKLMLGDLITAKVLADSLMSLRNGARRLSARLSQTLQRRTVVVR